jgi:hypothetical protein
MAVVVCSRLAFQLSAICILIAPAIVGAEFLRSSCSDKQGYYANGSSYKANLDQLLFLASNSTGIDNAFYFYNSSYGETPDKVYAIALCRGDVKPDVCRHCLGDSKYYLRDIGYSKYCPNQKEAIAWLDECMLRYSSRNILSTMEATPEFPLWNNDSVSEEAKAQFNDQLLSLLQSLRDRAAAGGSLRKFAVGHAAAPNNQTIYALVQCTPDLSEQDCNNCLSGAFGNFWKSYAGRIGGRILRPSCNFRYEINAFYNATGTASG